MTDQNPTPEQEHPGKVALDRISRAYEELKAVIQSGGAPAIKAHRAYVCEHKDWCGEGSHIPIAAYVSELEARADAAEAENARLREALYRLKTEPEMDDMAMRAALSTKPDTDDDREEVGRCEQCSKPIFEGDQYHHSGDGVDLCFDHAPMLSDAVEYLEGIVAAGKGDEDRSHGEAVEDLANLRARIAKDGDTKAVHTA